MKAMTRTWLFLGLAALAIPFAGCGGGGGGGGGGWPSCADQRFATVAWSIEDLFGNPLSCQAGRRARSSSTSEASGLFFPCTAYTGATDFGAAARELRVLDAVAGFRRHGLVRHDGGQPAGRLSDLLLRAGRHSRRRLQRPVSDPPRRGVGEGDIKPRMFTAGAARARIHGLVLCLLGAGASAMTGGCNNNGSYRINWSSRPRWNTARPRSSPAIAGGSVSRASRSPRRNRTIRSRWSRSLRAGLL